MGRTVHCKPSTSNSKVPDTPAQKTATGTTKVSSLKPKAKQPKTKAEPPPKKRKIWKEEFPTSPQRQSDEDGEYYCVKRNCIPVFIVGEHSAVFRYLARSANQRLLHLLSKNKF